MTRCVPRKPDPRCAPQSRRPSDQGKFAALVGLAILPFLVLGGPASLIAGQVQAGGDAAPGHDQQEQALSFSLYVLSRGTGVPEASADALRQLRGALEAYVAQGIQVRITETRIGLEGERRLCAEFEDQGAAHEAWRRAKAIVAGVELVNLKMEPCSG